MTTAAKSVAPLTFASEPILQPLIGGAPLNYLPATGANTLWGQLPCELDAAVLTVQSGATVVIDTISHEGILEDQGRDPVAFFAAHGVEEGQVLTDAIDIAAQGQHDEVDGPHVITGPVYVEGAQPADLLVVEIVSLQQPAPYGVISSRHGKGLLAKRFPVLAPSFSAFCPVREGHASLLTTLKDSRRARFALAPFLGVMGVITAGVERLNSTPPGLHGGNIDIALLVAGTTLYLPVQVPGAGFYVGDPHFAQGNGEIALTALEAPLRAELRLSVLPAAEALRRFGLVRGPFARTTDYLVSTGLDIDLDLAVAKCAENALVMLEAAFGMDAELAYAYLSAACDFQISQVVDMVKGAHAMTRLSDFDQVSL